MRHVNLFSMLGLGLFALTIAPGSATLGQVIQGDPIDPSTYGNSRVESMELAIRRDMARRLQGPDFPKARNGVQGVWSVPSRRGTFNPHSGNHYITNQWDNTCLKII